MQYRLEWYIPKRVLMLTTSGDVSMRDLADLNRDMIRSLECGITPVHLVSVAENIRRAPTNLMLIKETVTYLRHPHMGWTIVVHVEEKTNPVAGFILSVAVQATGMKMYRVKGIADGLEVLRRLDPTIDEDLSPV